MKRNYNNLITTADYLNFENNTIKEIVTKFKDKLTETNRVGLLEEITKETIASLKTFLVNRIKPKKVNIEEVYEITVKKILSTLEKDGVITKKEKDLSEIIIYRTIKIVVSCIDSHNRTQAKEMKNEVSNT